MKHVGIEIKFYYLDTFKKQIDVNFIDLESELVDLNYKVASLIFCHFWPVAYGSVNITYKLCSIFSASVGVHKVTFKGFFRRRSRSVWVYLKLVQAFHDLFRRSSLD